MAVLLQLASGSAADRERVRPTYTDTAFLMPAFELRYNGSLACTGRPQMYRVLRCGSKLASASAKLN
jgi:hypothetical protein